MFFQIAVLPLSFLERAKREGGGSFIPLWLFGTILWETTRARTFSTVLDLAHTPFYGFFIASLGLKGAVLALENVNGVKVSIEPGPRQEVVQFRELNSPHPFKFTDRLYQRIESQLLFQNLLLLVVSDAPRWTTVASGAQSFGVTPTRLQVNYPLQQIR